MFFKEMGGETHGDSDRRMEAEIEARWPQAKEAMESCSHQSGKRERSRLSSLQREQSPADTWISDFQPAEL